MKKIVLIFSLVVSISATAQTPQFNQVELLRKNEAIQVNAIYPDRIGYLWVGTNKGLFRFDGIESIQFKKSDGLSDDHVTALAQDSLGRIWCGHQNGMLSIIEKNKISSFEPSEGSASGLISDILFDRSGRLWFATHNDGLYYYVNKRLYRIDENEGLPDLFLYDLEEDNAGNIWAGSDAGIAICTLHDTKVTVNVISTESGLPDNIIHKIKQDQDGTFWLGTEDAGIIHYLPSSKKFEQQQIPHIKPVNDFILEGNNIWLVTKNQGVILFDKVLKTTSVFREGLPVVDVVAKDAEGNIWFGSKKGLQRSYGNHISFIDFKDDLKDDNVYAVTPDSKNDLWFSTQEGLFTRHKNDDGSYTLEKPLKGSSFEKLFIISLYTDTDGFIWAGSYGQGLLRINSATKSVKHFSKELRNGNVLSITGKDQTIWIATLGGITKLQHKGEQYDIQNIGSPEGLSSDYIYQVFIDSRERVWLATDGKGVDMIDDEGIHHFMDSLASKVVYGFAEDFHHAIWANVQNDGLYVLEGNHFQLGNDSTLIDLRNNDIDCITSTQRGDLIVVHDFGLDVFYVQKKQHHNLGTEQDFKNRHPNLNATSRDEHGTIYFGTEGGIVVYSGGVQNLPSNPTPHIENLKVSNQIIEVDDHLRFSYQQNNITFNYLGFWYQNTDVINFKYKLENYDHEWIASQDRTATYSNLPPGDYTFRLKVSNNTLFGSNQEATLHFSIQPPFWRTYWFYCLCGVAVIAAGYGLITYREKKLIANKHELEEKVKQRTTEVMKMNQEINEQAEEIKIINENLEMLVRERTNELNRKNEALEEAAFINAHNLRSPVANILGLIHLITKLHWSEQDKEYIQHLDQSAKRLDDVVKTISQAINKGDDLPYTNKTNNDSDIAT